MNNQKFTSLLILYAGFIWFSHVSSSIIPVYLLGKGIDINQMFLASALQFIPMLIVLVFIRIHSARLSWQLSIVFKLLAVLSIINVRYDFQIYLTYIFSGISLALFFLYYNIGHFLYTPKGRIGVSGGIMFAVDPAIAILAPLIAGYLAATHINYLWFISLLSSFLAYSLTYIQQDFKIQYSIKESLDTIRSTRIPIFIQGIWEAVLWGFIPISTLHFITSLAGYGQFIAYLSLIGTIAGLLVGHFSDKLGKRSFLLTPIAVILSITTIGLIWGIKSFVVWIILVSIIKFTIPIFWNITTALVVDQSADVTVAFPGREIVLAFGRLLGLVFTYICIMNSQINLLLITLALVILALPTYLYYQSKVTHQFSYM